MSLFPAKPDPNRNSGWALLSGKVSTVEDLWEDAAYTIKDLAKQATWRSHMSVPMIRLDETMGVISVARPDPTVFSEAQKRLLETFATYHLVKKWLRKYL